MGRGGQEGSWPATQGAGAIRPRGENTDELLGRILDPDLARDLRAALPELDDDERPVVAELARIACNPSHRRLSKALAGEPLERHAKLATVAGRSPRAHVLAADEEALLRLSGKAKATPAGGELQARGVQLELPGGRSVIAISAAESERIAAGETSATLVHELIHATQGAADFPYSFGDAATEADARMCAELLCEGVTEALTELRVGGVDGTYVAERAAIRELLAGAQDYEAALEELSQAEWDERAVLIAQRVFSAEEEPVVWDLCNAYRIKALELEINDPRGQDVERRGGLEPELRRIMRGLIARTQAV